MRRLQLPGRRRRVIGVEPRQIEATLRLYQTDCEETREYTIDESSCKLRIAGDEPRQRFARIFPGIGLPGAKQCIRWRNLAAFARRSHAILGISLIAALGIVDDAYCSG